MTDRWKVAIVATAAALIPVGIVMVHQSSLRAGRAEGRAAAAEVATKAAEARMETHEAVRKALAARADAAEARIRTLETDLHAARSRAAQLLIEKSEAEAAATAARKELAERTAAAAPVAESPTTPDAEPEPPAATAPAPIPRVPALGPTAVTDPGQVKKVVEGLNAILALGEGEESWSITSAEAVDGDRLVRVRIEARDKGEGLSRSFRAAEARFVLIPSTRTLEVRFRDGEVTYPGNRTVEFPGGRYSALLTVDPAPVRNAAHPLVEVPAR